MGFAIPEPYVWDESFKVFYEQLDEEHKGLFQGVFNVAANPSDGAALAHLKKAVTDHFTFEEGQMKKNSYADFDAHKAIHTQFLSDAAGLQVPVTDAQVAFVKDWLVNHIKATDFKYRGKLG